MENLTSIKCTITVDKKLKKIALTLGRSKRQVLTQMVEYFYRNKKDPTDLSDDLLKNSLAKSHKTYMGFIKAQEDLLLVPIKQAADKMIANQRDIVKFFNGQVLGANKNIIQNQEAMTIGIAELDKLIRAVYRGMEQKDQLKTKFLTLLNQYIRAREVLGTEEDARKFFGKGNQAAGTRLRLALQQVKVLAQQVRVEVSEKKKKK